MRFYLMNLKTLKSVEFTSVHTAVIYLLGSDPNHFAFAMLGKPFEVVSPTIPQFDSVTEWLLSKVLDG